jgi:hypothetical protein
VTAPHPEPEPPSPRPSTSTTGTEATRCAAIALVSAAIILLQIATTRLLSVLLWYHFAFFAITVAMLGVGAPGIWLSFARPSATRLGTALLAAGGLVPIGVALVVHGQHWFGGWAIVYCLACLLPGALALGTAVCSLLVAAPGRSIGRLYAFDLLGAGVGAVVIVPLLDTLPTPELAASVGLLPLGAAVLLAMKSERRRRVWLVSALCAAAILGATGSGRAFKVKHTKEYAEQGESFTPIWEKWTATARLTVFDRFPWDPNAGFRWGVGSRYEGRDTPLQYWLEQDSSAGTPIVDGRGGLARLDYLLYDVTSVGYQLRPARRAAIIGAGGGRDIWTARLTGVRALDAIELHPEIVTAMRSRFAEFSGDPYGLPGVHAIAGEGRSVLTRSPYRYDLVQLSMIDSWTATAAGAYALSENNLYTVEAYRLYFRKLTDTGLVSTSRWMPGQGYGLELPRLLLLVRAALEAEGIAEPREHIAVVAGGRVGTVLMSRAAWSDDDRAALRRICDERGFVTLWPEDRPEGAPKGPGARLMAMDPAALAPLGLRLAPPTDDKPFFFQMLSPFGLWTPAVGQQAGVGLGAVVALRRLMMVAAAVTLLLFFAPFALSRWMGRGARFWRGSAYFVAIGLGFMLVEIAWLQRFVLYLGHPSRATTTALAALLLGAGLGSMVSVRIEPERARRWGWALGVLCAALTAAQAPLFAATLGWPLFGRIAVSAALFGLAGFAMGLPFPLGMASFGEGRRPWYWALNGAAGVLASVGSLALAMELGLAAVAYFGAGCYLVAWLLTLGRAGAAPSDA